MKKILSLLALSSLMLLALPVSAQEISGTGSGEITVNGTLGADNKEEEAPIIEGEDAWINVDVPMETIFYSAGTETNAPIKSPEYTITNNSGRPVKILFSKLEKAASSDSESANYDVSLNGFGTNNPSIISAGTAVNNSSAPVLLHTLANAKGKLASADSENAHPKALTYSYTGTVNETLTQTIKHNFDMTLEFEAVDWTPAP